MILAVLTIVLVWLALSALTAALCSTLARGGLLEDRVRGFVPAPGPGLVGAGHASVPPPRLPPEGMAEFSG